MGQSTPSQETTLIMETWTTKLWLLLVMALIVAEAQDVVCKKGKLKKKIKIGEGDSYSFKTQAGATYAPKTKCSVIYKRVKASCPMIMFRCSEFNINNKDATCKRADKMIVQEGKETKKSYCQSVGPDVTTSASILKVSFVSDRKRQASGAECTVSCYDGPTTAEPATTTTTGEEPVSMTTTTTEQPPTTTGPTVAPPTGTTLPNPGSAAVELTLSLDQRWSQEPEGYARTAFVTVPATTAGQKVPVVFHLHGNGGQGNTIPVGSWLGDDCIIVAPNGYERSWNVYTEKSKADDVSFIIDLIAKIGAEIPAADMNNVNIIGTSNGAALTYRM